MVPAGPIFVAMPHSHSGIVSGAAVDTQSPCATVKSSDIWEFTVSCAPSTQNSTTTLEVSPTPSLLTVAVIVTVSPGFGDAGEQTISDTVRSGPTFTMQVSVPVARSSSVTVSVAVYVPGVE